jgi:uncharacterized SAM-binding protein YcdF (DUF218 family)
LRFLAVALAGAAIVLARHTLLAGFANLFRVDDPAQSDAIVLLLGGITHRPARVAKLYRSGIAPAVWLGTGARDDPLEPDETARTVAVLISLGIPGASIHVLPGPVTSTREEAGRVRRAVLESGARRLTIVTSNFHTRRARRIFYKTLKDLHVEVHTAAVDEPRYAADRWYRTDEGLVMYFTEAFKTLYYWIAY